MGYNSENPNDVWLFVDTQDFRWSDYQVEGEEDAIRVELYGAEATADFIVSLRTHLRNTNSLCGQVSTKTVFVVHVGDESKGLKIVDLAE